MSLPIPSSFNRLVRHVFITIAAITFISTIVYISKSEIKEWDESRNGINAYEMLQRGSWLVPYFEDEVDTWNAKPPLLHWCIMFSFKLFGMNVFSMRLPSLIASVGFFFVFYHLVLLFAPVRKAQLACIILLTCKAVLGDHIGLTADFDSMLLFFLILSVYFTIRYIQNGNRNALVCVAISTGLAFWTKGVAGLILLPSMACYVFFSRKKGDETKWIIPRDLVLASSVLSMFILTWTFLSVALIHYPVDGVYGSKSQLETMWIHDVFNRLFTDDSGQFTTGHKWYFVFAAVETRMQLWGILFFVLMVWIIFNKKNIFEEKEKNLFLLCSLIILPSGLLLTLSKNQHNWYLAPVYPFVALVLTNGIEKLIQYRSIFVLLAILIVIQAFRQNLFLLTDRDEIPVSQGFEETVCGKTVYYEQLPQDVILKLIFMEARPVKWKGAITDTLDFSALWLKKRGASETSVGSIGPYQVE